VEDTEHRFQLTDDHIDTALRDIINLLSERLDKKGRGIFLSSHEILGLVTEEMGKLEEAVRKNDPENQKRELMDIAVAAILGVASRITGKMDW
jgi:hypothetical protein